MDFHVDDEFSETTLVKNVRARKLNVEVACAFLEELKHLPYFNPDYDRILGEIPPDRLEFALKSWTADWKREREARDLDKLGWVLALGLFW